MSRKCLVTPNPRDESRNPTLCLPTRPRGRCAEDLIRKAALPSAHLPEELEQPVYVVPLLAHPAARKRRGTFPLARLAAVRGQPHAEHAVEEGEVGARCRGDHVLRAHAPQQAAEQRPRAELRLGGGPALLLGKGVVRVDPSEPKLVVAGEAD